MVVLLATAGYRTFSLFHNQECERQQVLFDLADHGFPYLTEEDRPLLERVITDRK